MIYVHFKIKLNIKGMPTPFEFLSHEVILRDEILTMWVISQLEYFVPRQRNSLESWRTDMTLCEGKMGYRLECKMYKVVSRFSTVK